MLRAWLRRWSNRHQARRYDRETLAVMDKVLSPTANCVDVGAHTGMILKEMIRRAPAGTHYAFEPIPDCFERLQHNVDDHEGVRLFRVALGAQAGQATFQHVVTRPTFSGLVRREMDPSEKVVPIEVECARLDDVIDHATRIDFIKIDVEGGELGVLQGARRTLERCKPVVVFEHGVGGADHYGTTPKDIFDELSQVGLRVSLMSRFLRDDPPIGPSEFEVQFYDRQNYYFIAYPEAG